MSDLDEREAFLRAIFDSPDDDTPRLVYADWLEEHDFPDHAGLIRIQCELSKRKPGDNPSPEQYRLQAQYIRSVNLHDRPPITSAFPNRGFRFADQIVLAAEDLEDAGTLRERAALRHPEWFGATSFALAPSFISKSDQIDTLLELACFERVSAFDFTGGTTAIGNPFATSIADLEFRYEPRISRSALDYLIQHRGVRRIAKLSLYNNNLDNDALRALMRSPHLQRLKELDISRGNTFRGRVWAEFQAHFGEEVVS